MGCLLPPTKTTIPYIPVQNGFLSPQVFLIVLPIFFLCNIPKGWSPERGWAVLQIQYLGRNWNQGKIFLNLFFNLLYIIIRNFNMAKKRVDSRFLSHLQDFFHAMFEAFCSGCMQMEAGYSKASHSLFDYPVVRHWMFTQPGLGFWIGGIKSSGDVIWSHLRGSQT